MVIGVPREIMHGENRVSVIPETVSKLKNDGFRVLIEKGAGVNSLYRDEEYADAGAEIIEDAEELAQEIGYHPESQGPNLTLQKQA